MVGQAQQGRVQYAFWSPPEGHNQQALAFQSHASLCNTSLKVEAGVMGEAQ